MRRLYGSFSNRQAGYKHDRSCSVSGRADVVIKSREFSREQRMYDAISGVLRRRALLKRMTSYITWYRPVMPRASIRTFRFRQSPQFIGACSVCLRRDVPHKTGGHVLFRRRIELRRVDHEMLTYQHSTVQLNWSMALRASKITKFSLV